MNETTNNSFDYDLIITKTSTVRPTGNKKTGSTDAVKLVLKLNFAGVLHADVCEHAAQKLVINHAAKVRGNWKHYVDLEDKTIELMVKDDFGQTGGSRQPTFADLLELAKSGTDEQKAQILALIDRPALLKEVINK